MSDPKLQFEDCEACSRLPDYVGSSKLYTYHRPGECPERPKLKMYYWMQSFVKTVETQKPGSTPTPE